MGFWDNTCLLVLASPASGRSTPRELDRAARDAAVDNIRDNSDRLPIVVPARVGRLLAVFRPSQTVDFVAQWMRVDTGLIWAWVASFWVILALAIGGAIAARSERDVDVAARSRRSLLVLVEMLVFYGEPRYHSMADLGLVVLAGFAIDRLLTGAPPEGGEAVDATAVASGADESEGSRPAAPVGPRLGLRRDGRRGGTPAARARSSSSPRSTRRSPSARCSPS